MRNTITDNKFNWITVRINSYVYLGSSQNSENKAR